jgi:hypothetical protein
MLSEIESNEIISLVIMLRNPQRIGRDDLIRLMSTAADIIESQQKSIVAAKVLVNKLENLAGLSKK